MKASHHLVDGGHRFLVAALRVPFRAAVDHEAQPVAEVVEDQNQLRENEMEVRLAQVVRQRGGQLLEEPHVVVADEPHGAPAERGLAWNIRRANLPQQALQHRERILTLHPLRALPAPDLDRGSLRAELDHGPESQQRVTAPVLPALEALEEQQPHPDVVTHEQIVEGMGAVMRILVAHGFQLPKDLVLFFKNLLYLNGLAATLAPDLNLLGEIDPIFQYFAGKYEQQLSVFRE